MDLGYHLSQEGAGRVTEMDWGVLQAWGGDQDVLGCPLSPSMMVHVPTVPSKWGLVLERLIVLGWTFSDTLTRGQVFVVRLLELHMVKLVALYIVWVALQEVPAMGHRSWGAQPGTPWL